MKPTDQHEYYFRKHKHSCALMVVWALLSGTALIWAVVAAMYGHPKTTISLVILGAMFGFVTRIHWSDSMNYLGRVTDDHDGTLWGPDKVIPFKRD